MKNNKIAILSSSVIIALSLAITGCTQEKTDPPAASSSASDNGGEEDKNTSSSKNNEGVSETVNSYYSHLISDSSTAMKNSEEVEKIIREVSGDASYEAFANTTDPFSEFDDLNEEQAKELADRIQELNPSADFFDYSQMNDKDRAVLNLLIIASSVFLSPLSEQTVKMTVPDESITIDGNSATVSYSKLTMLINEEEQVVNDVLGTSSLHLTYVNGVWKIDGQKTYESIYANAQSVQDASDG